MIIKLSLELPEEKEFVWLARKLGKSTLEYLDTLQADVDDVETIISELTSNAIRHAHSTDSRFGITLEYYKQKVVITVKDQGNGFSLAEAGEKPEERTGFEGELRLGGYGLTLVTALSDSIQLTQSERHGSTVRVEKLLSHIHLTTTCPPIILEAENFKS